MTNKSYNCCVVIPAYNAERYIERCLRSLLDQTEPQNNYTIVVVDDGSVDNTNNIISEYFPQVHLVTFGENKGLPAALNAGIKAVSSQFILRVDSDDFVDSRYVEYMNFAILNNPHCHAISCDYYLVDQYETRLERKNSTEEPIGCGLIFRRETLIELGLYDENFLAREEEDLFYRFKQGNYVIERLSLPLYRYRKHGQGITDSHQNMAYYKELLSKKHNNENG